MTPSASATQVWGAIQRTNARGQLIDGGLSQRQRAERHNLRPSVSQQGRQQTEERTTYKGRTGHRNART
eukprot:scaffold101544_cov60-Phaeocystis_antarctica.AAC.5